MARYLLCLLFLVFSCSEKPSGFVIDDTYKTDFEAYNTRVNDGRVKYLQLTGLFKLDSLDNFFGKSPETGFSLPIETLPDVIANISIGKDSIYFTPADQVVITNADKEPVSAMALALDEYGSSQRLYHDRLNWQVITRSGQLYLRVWDTENPAVEAFKGYEVFELNPDLIFDGQFAYYDEAKTESVKSQLGVNANTNFIGQVTFDYKGETYSLDVGSNGFTMISDATTGDETYGGGRYIYLDLPETNGPVHMDLNRLYNPPCSFSEYTTCLYPPRQNHMPFKITAGEMLKTKN